MHDDKCAGSEALRRPGMRRILDALKTIEEERPGLLEEASLASGELARQRSDGGRLPQ